VAVNCCVAPSITVALVGATLTLMPAGGGGGGGGGGPGLAPPPPQPVVTAPAARPARRTSSTCRAPELARARMDRGLLTTKSKTHAGAKTRRKLGWDWSRHAALLEGNLRQPTESPLLRGDLDCRPFRQTFRWWLRRQVCAFRLGTEFGNAISLWNSFPHPLPK